jgi:hypothetical protein
MDSRGEGLFLSASSGNDSDAAPAEAYGPIELRRYVKGDGRALILYTDGGLADDDPAREGTTRDDSAHEGTTDDGPADAGTTHDDRAQEQDRPPRG